MFRHVKLLFGATVASSALVGLIVMLSAPGACAAPPMQPGLWEITTTMEMPGMPFAMQPTKTTQCIKDVGNTEGIIPRSQTCEILSQSATGDTVTWTMRCREGNAVMTGSGEITLRGTSYEGATRMTVREANREATRMTFRYSARRVGDCQ